MEPSIEHVYMTAEGKAILHVEMESQLCGTRTGLMDADLKRKK